MEMIFFNKPNYISNCNLRSKWIDKRYFSVLTILRTKWQNQAVIGQRRRL